MAAPSDAGCERAVPVAEPVNGKETPVVLWNASPESGGESAFHLFFFRAEFHFAIRAQGVFEQSIARRGLTLCLPAWFGGIVRISRLVAAEALDQPRHGRIDRAFQSAWRWTRKFQVSFVIVISAGQVQDVAQGDGLFRRRRRC